MSYLMAFMTAPSREEAGTIARTLVEERLAACCTIIDRVESVYRWEGAVEEGSEVLVLIKTSAERFDAMAARAVELHSYDLPEMIAVPVVAGSQPYLDWIGAGVSER